MLPRGLLKEYHRVIALILQALDITAIVVAGLAAYYFKFQTFDVLERYQIALLIGACLTAIVFPFLQIYKSMRGKGAGQYVYSLLQATGFMLLLMAGLAFITKTGENFSREWFLWWAAFSLSLLLLFRCSLLLVLRVMRSHGWNERRVIIIGGSDLGRKLAEAVQQALWTGFRIVAIHDDQAADKPKHIAGIPVVQTPDNISAYVAQMKEPLDEIWLALPLGAEVRLKQLLYELRHHTISIRFVLDVFGMELLNHSISDLAGFPTLNLNSSPMIGINRVVKAIEDRILAASILVLISPLLFLIALGVKCTSRGPIFFKQARHGWDGRIIKIYKFRTMYQHQENNHITQAKVSDYRITPFGRFLRKTSLDELPQFINVLQGRMSIVGPRPHAIYHNEFYKNSIKAYMQRHKVKPGITGWAQVNGWRGETETLEKMQKRVEYDLYYIENWSLRFDLKIIFLTLFQGFIHKNAY